MACVLPQVSYEEFGEAKTHDLLPSGADIPVGGLMTWRMGVTLWLAFSCALLRFLCVPLYLAVPLLLRTGVLNFLLSLGAEGDGAEPRPVHRVVHPLLA